MAQLSEVVLTGDGPDGATEAVETVTCTVEGHARGCELCDGHLTKFREAMEDRSSLSRLDWRGRIRAEVQAAYDAAH